MCKYDDRDDDDAREIDAMDGWMDGCDRRTIGSRGRGCFRGRDWRIEREPMDGILGGIGRVGCSDARTIADVVFLCVVYMS